MHLPGFGKEGQKKLKQAKVLCVGAGGLANSALQYLASSGIGRITIADGDIVEKGNLHRQVLFNENDINKNKAEVAAIRLSYGNSGCHIKAVPEFVSIENVDVLMQGVDVVLDCSDNFYTRYLVSDFCHLYNKPDIFAAVVGYEGYVAIFSNNSNPCYRCLYAVPPAISKVVNCASSGVLSTTPGLLGLIQATEAIKVIADVGQPLNNELLKIDLYTMGFSKREIKISKNCSCQKKVSKKNILLALNHLSKYATHKITKLDIGSILDIPKSYEIIDVRETDEYEDFNLGFTNSPCSEFNVDCLTLPKNTKILICCSKGIRSLLICQKLLEAGYTQVATLVDGVEKFRVR